MPARIARRGQIALGVLWLIDGALQCQPYMFGKSFVTGVLLPSAAGQPPFIGAPLTWLAHLIEPHVAVFNGFAAATQILIGLGLLYRRTVRPALVISFLWALGVWVAGEGLGMLLTGSASPLTGAPGAALLYMLAGLLCWPGRAPTACAQGDHARGLISDRHARLAWSAVWLGCAVLWLLPANSSAGAVHDAIASAPSGAPWLSQVLGTAAAGTAGHGAAIAIVLAVTSGTIGLGILCGWRPQAFLALQIMLAALYWVFGQGLAGVFTGRATDVGTAPLTILIALMVAHLPGRADIHVVFGRPTVTAAGGRGLTLRSRAARLGHLGRLPTRGATNGTVRWQEAQAPAGRGGRECASRAGLLPGGRPAELHAARRPDVADHPGGWERAV